MAELPRAEAHETFDGPAFDGPAFRVENITAFQVKSSQPAERETSEKHHQWQCPTLPGLTIYHY
jgi:hypothetical protein